MESVHIPIEVESNEHVKFTASSEIFQGKESSSDDQYFQQNYQIAIFEKI